MLECGRYIYIYIPPPATLGGREARRQLRGIITNS